MRLLSNSRPVIGSSRPETTSLGVRDHINPASGKMQATVNICGAREVEAAVTAAVRGQHEWAALPSTTRRDMLFKLAALIEAEIDEIAHVTALEVGTPVATNGSRLALQWMRYYAGWSDKIDGTIADPIGARGIAYARHEPIGVIGVIIPWNSPLIAISMTAILALAGGNAVVLKPPTQTPFVALRVGELALEAGIPPGTLCVVPGDAEAGTALIANEMVGKVSFTGGEEVARSVMQTAAGHLKPLALELGGKSASIVFPDADIEAASQMASRCSVMMGSGQGCVFPTRVYVHDDIFDQFVEMANAVVDTATLGDPLDPNTLVGPVITEASAVRIMGVIERAKQEAGGRLIRGGRRGTGVLASGAYVEPTIFSDVDHDSHLAREEVFGPVLAIMRFRTEEEALYKANNSRFGLGAYLHTRDLARAHRMAEALKAGAVSINGMLPMSPNMPFGGMKESGFGREGGRPGLEEFMQIKQVMIHL